MWIIVRGLIHSTPCIRIYFSGVGWISCQDGANWRRPRSELSLSCHKGWEWQPFLVSKPCSTRPYLRSPGTSYPINEKWWMGYRETDLYYCCGFFGVVLISLCKEKKKRLPHLCTCRMKVNSKHIHWRMWRHINNIMYKGHHLLTPQRRRQKWAAELYLGRHLCACVVAFGSSHHKRDNWVDPVVFFFLRLSNKQFHYMCIRRYSSSNVTRDVHFYPSSGAANLLFFASRLILLY